MIIKLLDYNNRKAPKLTVTMLVVVFLFPVTFPAPLLGGCHCFKDRTFDPMQPASADPYVLATARNSLVAAASGVTKGMVVKKRMTGATETEVWLTLYLESPGGREGAAAIGLDTTGSKSWDGEVVAAALADRVLALTYKATRETLTGLRAAGADTAGATLSLFVSSRTGRAAGEIFAEVEAGRTTWGKAVSSLGIPLDSTGDLIMEDVKKSGVEN